MKPYDWREFVHALATLGIEQVLETQHHVVLCRGAAKLQTVAKALLSVEEQRLVIKAFAFSEGQLAAALEKVTTKIN